MNDMKKLFCTIAVACLALSAWAVDLPKQGFGFQIGWAQPILRINRPNNPANAKDSLSSISKLNGFKVGITYDASYIAGFGSSMGINYTFATASSGWKAAGSIADYPRSRQMIYYHEVEVFVDWQYKFEVAKETYLMLYTGPTIQCGIGLDMRVDRQAFSDADITTLHYSGYKSEDPDQLFRRLNITWGLGAGFQYRRYFVRGGYDFGLMNPYKNADFTNGNHTRGRLDQWSVKIGMYLWYDE